jgi:hypothetical protein
LLRQFASRPLPLPPARLVAQPPRLPAAPACGARPSAPPLCPLCSEGLLAGFHMHRYQKGHGPTDFDRWAATDGAYEAHYAQGFEPYVLMLRRHVPW